MSEFMTILKLIYVQKQLAVIGTMHRAWSSLYTKKTQYIASIANNHPTDGSLRSGSHKKLFRQIASEHRLDDNQLYFRTEWDTEEIKKTSLDQQLLQKQDSVNLEHLKILILQSWTWKFEISWTIWPKVQAF